MVSIIVPTYKSEKFIYKHIEILFKEIAQLKINNFELIILDDASPDNTYNEILKLKEISNKIISFRTKQNYGQFLVTNFGLMKSKGDVIITLDDDLKYHPKYIKSLLSKSNDKTNFIIYGFLKGDIFRSTIRIILDFIAGKKRNSSFRCFDASVLPKNRILKKQLDVFLVGGFKDLNYEMIKVEYETNKNPNEKSRTNVLALLWFYFRSFYTCDNNRLGVLSLILFLIIVFSFFFAKIFLLIVFPFFLFIFLSLLSGIFFPLHVDPSLVEIR